MTPTASACYSEWPEDDEHSSSCDEASDSDPEFVCPDSDTSDDFEIEDIKMKKNLLSLRACSVSCLFHAKHVDPCVKLKRSSLVAWLQ